MKITIELYAGSNHRTSLNKEDIDRNIEAQKRAIKGKPLACDSNYLIDTKSILEAIKQAITNSVNK